MIRKNSSFKKLQNNNIQFIITRYFNLQNWQLILMIFFVRLFEYYLWSKFGRVFVGEPVYEKFFCKFLNF